MWRSRASFEPPRSTVAALARDVGDQRLHALGIGAEGVGGGGDVRRRGRALMLLADQFDLAAEIERRPDAVGGDGDGAFVGSPAHSRRGRPEPIRHLDALSPASADVLRAAARSVTEVIDVPCPMLETVAPSLRPESQSPSSISQRAVFVTLPNQRARSANIAAHCRRHFAEQHREHRA